MTINRQLLRLFQEAGASRRLLYRHRRHGDDTGQFLALCQRRLFVDFFHAGFLFEQRREPGCHTRPALSSPARGMRTTMVSPVSPEQFAKKGGPE